MLYENAIADREDSRVAPRQHSRNIRALGDASVSVYCDSLLHDERTIGGIQPESALRHRLRPG